MFYLKSNFKIILLLYTIFPINELLICSKKSVLFNIGAINEIYDMLAVIIGGETNGIVNTSYDNTTGNLVLTASNGAIITYDEATGNLSITNSSTNYDNATGNINIK